MADARLVRDDQGGVGDEVEHGPPLCRWYGRVIFAALARGRDYILPRNLVDLIECRDVLERCP